MFVPSYSLLLAQLLLSCLVLACSTCPGGGVPICPPLTKWPPAEDPGKTTSEQPVTCPKSCNPHSNTCDPTTAPSCIYPDPTVAKPHAACACRPGYKATGYSDNDAAKQWRLPVKGQEYRVWVAEGVKCDTLCKVPHGVESCLEVTLISDQCIGQTSKSPPPKNPAYMDNSIPYVMNVESTPYRDTYVIQDSEVFGEKSLVIPFYHPDNATMSKKAYLEDLVDDFADSIGRALPTYLTQYGVPEHEAHAIVNDTLPALASAVLLVFNPENQTTLPPGKDDKSAYYDVSQEPHQLARRKWNVPPLNQIVTHGAKELGRQVEAGYNKVKEKISEVGRNDAVCSYFAYSALPGYLLESNAVASRKPGPGVPLTHDQMFFLYPVYGSYPQDENLRAHYGISKAPVESYRAITFNRDMYLIDSTSIFGRPWASADDFQSVTRTLVHEVRHTQQYRALGFSKSAFGMKYLYQYCKAGWSYSQIDYEREARLYEGLADQLLMRELGYSFFEYWKERHLYYTLGYPIDRAIVATTGPSSKVGHYELRFQNGGVLQGINYADCSRCFRVLSPTALAYRRVSDACTQQGDPWGYCADFHRWWRDQQPHYECVEALRRRLVNGKCI